MSHNSHRKQALNETLPLKHRASHARSCAIYVANRLRISREEAIQKVEQGTNISLHAPANASELVIAVHYLESLQPD
jgi:hypothetical protein